MDIGSTLSVATLPWYPDMLPLTCAQPQPRPHVLHKSVQLRQWHGQVVLVHRSAPLQGLGNALPASERAAERGVSWRQGMFEGKATEEKLKKLLWLQVARASQHVCAGVAITVYSPSTRSCGHAVW